MLVSCRRSFILRSSSSSTTRSMFLKDRTCIPSRLSTRSSELRMDAGNLQNSERRTSHDPTNGCQTSEHSRFFFRWRSRPNSKVIFLLNVHILANAAIHVSGIFVVLDYLLAFVGVKTGDDESRQDSEDVWSKIIWRRNPEGKRRARRYRFERNSCQSLVHCNSCFSCQFQQE